MVHLEALAIMVGLVVFMTVTSVTVFIIGGMFVKWEK